LVTHAVLRTPSYHMPSPEKVCTKDLKIIFEKRLQLQPPQTCQRLTTKRSS